MSCVAACSARTCRRRYAPWWWMPWGMCSPQQRSPNAGACLPLMWSTHMTASCGSSSVAATQPLAASEPCCTPCLVERRRCHSQRHTLHPARMCLWSMMMLRLPLLLLHAAGRAQSHCRTTLPCSTPCKKTFIRCDCPVQCALVFVGHSACRPSCAPCQTRPSLPLLASPCPPLPLRTPPPHRCSCGFLTTQ